MPDYTHFSHVPDDDGITLSVCQHCSRVVVFAAEPDKLQVAEAAHIERCHRPEERGDRGAPVPLLVCDNSFSVNIAALDSEHSRLVGMLNVLSECVAWGEGKEVAAPMLNALLAYTKAHFKTEEALLQKHGYAGLAAHKAEHDSMTATLEQFMREFEENASDIAPRLLRFLRDWLSNHIIKSDRQYSAFLRGHGER